MAFTRIAPGILVVASTVTAGASGVTQARCYELAHTFEDPTPRWYEFFGGALELDGDRVLIGAYNIVDPNDPTEVGQAHLFDATTGELLRTFDDPTPTTGDLFGWAVDLQADRILISAPGDDTLGLDVGQVHLFDSETGELLRTFDDPTPTQADSFGSIEGAKLAGNRVLVGAIGDDTLGENVGQAYLFDASTGELLHILDDPTPNPFDSFAVAVELDGQDILIGDIWDDTVAEDAGQAHLFDAVSGELRHTFRDPTPHAEDSFGGAGDLDGGFALIAAEGALGGTGQAHLFDIDGGVAAWTFNDPTPTSADTFGYATKVDGDYVLIGAPGDSTHAASAGQAHLFRLRTEEDVCACLAADFDGNGAVELEDLATLLNDFGCSDAPGLCEGDIDRDGDTDLTDLSLLLTVYGDACG